MRQKWRLNAASAAIVSLLIAVTGPTLFAQQALATRASKPPLFPLKLSENKRYLVDQKGTPFLIVADSPQGIMGRLTEQEAESYFADREAHGFNALGWIDVACAGTSVVTGPSADCFLPSPRSMNSPVSEAELVAVTGTTCSPGMLAYCPGSVTPSPETSPVEMFFGNTKP